MKKIFLTFIIIIFTGCTISPVYTNSYYQRERYYDDKGHYVGHSEQRQNSERIRYYNEHGRYQGYAIKTKYGTRYYDTKGHYIGKSQK